MQPATTPAPAAPAADADPAIWQLRRLVDALNHEYEALTCHIPTIPALIEYRALWDTYDTEYLSGIAEAIQDGDDPAPLNAFIRRYDLPWRPMADRDAARQAARVAAFCRAVIAWADSGDRATRATTPHLATLAALVAPPHDDPAATAGGEAYALAADILTSHAHDRRFYRATRHTLAERAASVLNWQETPPADPDSDPDSAAASCVACHAAPATRTIHVDDRPARLCDDCASAAIGTAHLTPAVAAWLDTTRRAAGPADRPLRITSR
jgi:hypothetical protein